MYIVIPEHGKAPGGGLSDIPAPHPCSAASAQSTLSLRPYKKSVGDHPFCFKEVGRDFFLYFLFFSFFFFETGMNVVVKIMISYILDRVFN